MNPIVPTTPSPFAVSSIPASLGANPHALSANVVPSDRQTMMGLQGKPATEAMTRDYTRQIPTTLIRHPREAPSAISSEQFLAAKSLLGPTFQHNIMATKMARISNLHIEAPRYRDQIDILA